MKIFDLSNTKGSITRYFLFLGLISICNSGTFPESPENKDDIHLFLSTEPSSKYNQKSSRDDFQIRSSYHPLNDLALDLYFIEEDVAGLRDLAASIRYELPLSTWVQDLTIPNIGFGINDFLGNARQYDSFFSYLKLKSDNSELLIGYGLDENFKIRNEKLWNNWFYRIKTSFYPNLYFQMEHFGNNDTFLISYNIFNQWHILPDQTEIAVGYNSNKHEVLINTLFKFTPNKIDKHKSSQTPSRITKFNNQRAIVGIYIEPDLTSALGTEFGSFEYQSIINQHLYINYWLKSHTIVSVPLYESKEFKPQGVYGGYVVHSPAIKQSLVSKQIKWKSLYAKMAVGYSFYDRITLANKIGYQFKILNSSISYIYFRDAVGKKETIEPQILLTNSIKLTNDINFKIELGQWAFNDKGFLTTFIKKFKYFNIRPSWGLSSLNERKVYSVALGLDLKFGYGYKNKLVRIGVAPTIDHRQNSTIAIERWSNNGNYLAPNTLRKLEHF